MGGGIAVGSLVVEVAVDFCPVLVMPDFTKRLTWLTMPV